MAAVRVDTPPSKRSAGLRWVPTSDQHIVDAEAQLLTLVQTKCIQEQVDIGPSPFNSKFQYLKRSKEQPRFINTVTVDNNESKVTIVLLHGYAASLGFFFRNFDALASSFVVVAIDQLGWGGSSRPDFTCKSTEETDTWFVDSFEDWRKAKNLSNFILLGHSFGGYVAAKYALKYPEHIMHLILVGPAGFSTEIDDGSEFFKKFKGTWKGAMVNHLWESNFTPQKIIRYTGPWGHRMVESYISSRFGSRSQGTKLTEAESKLFANYLYHTVAASACGELCLKYIFSFGAFARKPLLHHTAEWKVPTTFIYGMDDWMNYRGAQRAREGMSVPCEIIRVPEAGHFAFIDNPVAFHSAVFHACRRIISPDKEADDQPLPHGLIAV